MKISFFYSLIFLVTTAVSITFSDSLIPLILTLILLYRRKYVIAIEVLISILSFFLLFTFHKLYLYVFTVRALSYVNLYFIASEYVDYHTVINILGEKGVPLVVGLAYFPLFNEILSQIVFNARARKVGFFKILLPFTVEMVKVAEDLYVAYTIKLFGKYRGRINITPSSTDVLFVALALITLLLSVFFPLSLPQYHISI